MAATDPTADYRKYPKGPSFGLIVALAAVFILIGAVAVVLFLRFNATKVDPHGKNPTPNSLSVPQQPLAAPRTISLAA